MAKADGGGGEWTPSEAEIDRVARDVSGDEAGHLAALQSIWRHTAAPEGPDDWKAISRSIRPVSGRETPRGWTGWRPAAPLAAAALVAGLLVGTQLPSIRSGSAPVGSAPMRVEVPAGATSSIFPAEAVAIRIGPGSELAYSHTSRTTIDIFLEGEAFFEVEPGARSRLRVRTTAGEIRHIGTKFNVRARDERVWVTVQEGVVEFEASGTTVRVEAGEESAAVAGEPAEVPRPADLQMALGWLEGRLAFSDERLADVLAEVARRFGTRIELAEALREERLTANLRGTTLEAALATICSAVEARCHPTAGGWAVEPAGVPATR